MTELRRVEGLEITKLFQETRDLYDDAEDILCRRMIVDLEAFYSLIVLKHRVKAMFL